MHRLFAFLLMLFALPLSAQHLAFSKTLNKEFNFTENKGQLADEKGNLLPDIKYYGYANGAYV